MKKKISAICAMSSCFLFLFLSGNITLAAIAPAENSNDYSCIDSDSGIDYYTKGTVDYSDAGSKGHYLDLCFNGSDQLREWYCKGMQPTEIIKDCANGCQNGACFAQRNEKPDLAIDSIRIVPKKPSMSDEVCIYVSIKNVGIKDISSSDITIWTYINNKHISNIFYGKVLKIGEHMEKEALCSKYGENTVFRKGPNSVWVVADPDAVNVIDESNEFNNDMNASFDILEAGSFSRDTGIYYDDNIWEKYDIGKYTLNKEDGIVKTGLVAGSGTDCSAFETVQIYRDLKFDTGEKSFQNNTIGKTDLSFSKSVAYKINKKLKTINVFALGNIGNVYLGTNNYEYQTRLSLEIKYTDGSFQSLYSPLPWNWSSGRNYSGNGAETIFVGSNYCPSDRPEGLYVVKYSGIDQDKAVESIELSDDFTDSYPSTNVYAITIVENTDVPEGPAIGAKNSVLCIDTDGGQNIFEKGDVTYMEYSNTDQCASPDTLKEYYCDEDGIGRAANRVCEIGCKNGACFQDRGSLENSDQDGEALIDAINKVAGFETDHVMIMILGLMLGIFIIAIVALSKKM